MKKGLQFLWSGAGITVVAVAIVLINYIFSAMTLRVDLTDDQIYTLSDGTKAVLERVDAPITVNFYRSQGNAMPLQLRNYADRVEDLLNEYAEWSGGLVEVATFDPQPDTDAEDAARQEGIYGQPIQGGVTIYLSVAISYLDQTEVLPFLMPNRENLLEYDLTAAIARVMAAERPVVGLMSALPVMGEEAPFNPMMMRGGPQPEGKDPWIFVSELKKDYQVRELAMDVTEIPEEITTLLVIHPAGISEATEFALDQFVLRGGKLIACVDPHSFVAAGEAQSQLGTPPQMTSNLPKLFKGWGIKMDDGKVAGDAISGREINAPQAQFIHYSVLDLLPQSFNREAVVTSDLKSATLVLSGALEITETDGLNVQTLLETTPKSDLLNAYTAGANPLMAARNFKPGNEKLPLALTLSGRFKTAFPDGAPKTEAAKDAEEVEDSATESKNDLSEPAPLTESQQDGLVMIFADSDWLWDDFAVRTFALGNQRMVSPINGNLSLIQNAVDFAAGDAALISIRSRRTANRPFLKVKEIQDQANAEFKEKIEEKEAKLREVSARINELLRTNTSDSQQFIQSPEVQAEIEKLRDAESRNRQEVKALRKALRRDIESLENWCKFTNIILMPMLVLVVGLVVAFYRKKRSAAK